jgi:hypothetical protein
MKAQYQKLKKYVCKNNWLYNVLKRNVMPMVEVVSISIKWGVFVVLLGVFTPLTR